ncbi:ABC transporter substrate-binding protein [Geminicoccus roseus]|uniref:ABC transporter substrate-binding protein n=1 Tax=Geminicoccus roseus TaxID=404900 RepID=UPI0003F72B42|nr:ABC transporter substrate-binding protein [Geminicoccus roseus]
MLTRRTFVETAALAAAGAVVLPRRSPAQAAGAPPDEPRVLEGLAELGKRGGEMRSLIGRAKDTRMLTVYGYARLVGYDLDYQFVADILKSYEVEEGRIFTFHLRRGHKWSDGHPFTSEDFRFYWEDVANEPKLMPTGPEVQMLVDGEPPEVTFPDELTVRYAWKNPNPFFLPALAAAAPIYLYRPAHYLKSFHEKYASAEDLQKRIAATKSRDWADLFGRQDRISKIDNPDMPDVQPWVLVTEPPSERFVAERNPYFHRVDANGVQLPYLDRIVLEVVDSKLIPIKAGGGETDMQARGLFFKDYTFLKESEERSGLVTHLWKQAKGAHLALFPNLNAADDVWRSLFRDVRFRRALAISIDRELINQFLYFGLATPCNNTILPQSPLWTDEIGTANTRFDPEAASALMDELGLEMGAGGLRRLPDGRDLRLVVETAGEDSEQSDVLELVATTWKEVGFGIDVKPSQRDVLRNRIFSGEALMTIWYGIENGIPQPDYPPLEFVPAAQDQAQWPKWGQYRETKGMAGEAPDMPEAQALMKLFDDWRFAEDGQAQATIWHAILKNHAENVWNIGLVAGVMQPVVARPNLMNLPAEGIYNWEPGAHFGIYRPDSWWLKDA